MSERGPTQHLQQTRHDDARIALPPDGRAMPAARPDAPLPVRRRVVGRLFAAWMLYWAALLLVQAWPLARAWWRVKRSGGHGTISVSYSGGLAEAALWIAGPPLLMVVVWLLWTRRRRS